VFESYDFVFDVIDSGGDDVLEFRFESVIKQLEMLFCLSIHLFVESRGEFLPAMDEGAEWSLEDKSSECCSDPFNWC
jgi:hypothetical protein